ncbi:MAG: DUF2778 domain-containing protein [Shinella sp.]|nr:DUF2778 domain-containing protein [Shinella sp.]
MASAIEKSKRAGRNDRSVARGKPARSFHPLGLLLGIGSAAAIWLTGAITIVQATTADFPTGMEVRRQVALALPPAQNDTATKRLVDVGKSFRISQEWAERERLRRTTEMAERLGKREAVVVASIDPGRFSYDTMQDGIAIYTEEDEAIAVADAKPAAGNDASGSAAAGEAMLTALVDPKAATPAETRPFGLVLAAPDEAAPETIPLPEARPKALAQTGDDKDTDARRPARKELAYARPDLPEIDDGLGRKKQLFSGSMNRTAIYVIDSGVVIMPNGDRHEAHSGIGHMRDNPKYTHVKMKGPTPAGTYHLTMREKLFHGVEALRMTPVDGIAPLNRTGLLTHSYLLGANGNSHGCVAFKNYQPFLKAFKRGEINRMIVVENMGDVPRSSPSRSIAGWFKNVR